MEEKILSSNENKRNFNILIVESILKGIDFGEVVLRFLELNFNLDRNRIVDNPENFAKSLEKIFGSGMADIYLRNILRILYRKVGIKYLEDEELTFSEAINRAFKKYSEQIKPPV